MKHTSPLLLLVRPVVCRATEPILCDEDDSGCLPESTRTPQIILCAVVSLLLALVFVCVVQNYQQHVKVPDPLPHQQTTDYATFQVPLVRTFEYLQVQRQAFHAKAYSPLPKRVRELRGTR